MLAILTENYHDNDVCVVCVLYQLNIIGYELNLNKLNKIVFT